MEHQEILNLLNESSESKFVTRKWYILNDQSNANYDVVNEIIIIYSTEVVKSHLCDYNNAYILVRGDIYCCSNSCNSRTIQRLCTIHLRCITKIDRTTIDDAEDLHLVMRMVLELF